MKLNLRYFGMVAETTSKNDEIFEIENPVFNVNDLTNYLFEKYPQLTKMTFRIAVNQTLQEKDFNLRNEDEVAVLPPFAGG